MTGLSIVIAGDMEYRSGRCGSYYKSIPDDITVPGAVFILYFDDLPGVLCIYNDSWIGIITVKMSGVFIQWNQKVVKLSLVIYSCSIIGPYMTVSAVWTIADIFNGLMAIPNLIALVALSGVVVSETKIYLKRIGKVS